MERFWNKIDRREPNECWPWIGGISRGYGHWSFWESGKCRSTTSHRKAWELANGPIPAGLFVLHRCDNPPCCNPAHLWLGTHADNMADKVAKGRQWRGGRPRVTHCKRGHEYTEATEIWVPSKRNPNGKVRTCRICHNARSLASYHKRRKA